MAGLRRTPRTPPATDVRARLAASLRARAERHGPGGVRVTDDGARFTHPGIAWADALDHGRPVVLPALYLRGVVDRLDYAGRYRVETDGSVTREARGEPLRASPQ